MCEDHYTTLGVHRSASAEEIQAAYRRLVRSYHPDLNPDDAEAEKKFLRIQAAFEVLGDPGRRKAYDRTAISLKTVWRTATRRVPPGTVEKAFAAHSGISKLPKCSECGVDVAPDSGACWSCGSKLLRRYPASPISKPRVPDVVLAILIAVLLALFVFWSFG